MFARPLLLASIIGLSAPAILGQTAAEAPKKEISETAAGGLAKLAPLVEAKDYAGALALVESLLPKAAPGSYDLYILNQLKAQLLVTSNRLSDAISPLETSLKLAEGNPNFFDASANLEQINLLAQLHYQAAASAKTPEQQRPGYERALANMERWLAKSPKPTTDARLFCASIYYQLATLQPGKPDETLLRKAVTHGREGMLLALNPPTQLVQILVACHIQLGDTLAAAELLELLVSTDPKSTGSWPQLQSLYLALAGETKDPERSRAYNLRALHTLDRAQAMGQLISPRDNYTRVAILFNIGHYARAAELLERGLADGSLENIKRNWELLAYAYQQSSREEETIRAYARAAEKFPDQGDLEFALAQALYNAGRVAESYERAGKAVAKPALAKPGQTRLYLAFLAYELQRYDEALSWIEQARKDPDVTPAALDPIAKAVADAIKTREAAAKS